MDQHFVKAAEHAAPIATVGGAGSTIVFWGLHVNEVCAIISTAIAAMGLALQCYLAWRKHRMKAP